MEVELKTGVDVVEMKVDEAEENVVVEEDKELVVTEVRSTDAG